MVGKLINVDTWMYMWDDVFLKLVTLSKTTITQVSNNNYSCSHIFAFDIQSNL